MIDYTQKDRGKYQEQVRELELRLMGGEHGRGRNGDCSATYAPK